VFKVKWLRATELIKRRWYRPLAVGCVLLTACSSIDVAREVVSTVDMFGRQQSEQQSFLGLSSAIFYPKGVPSDVAQLPELGTIQLEAIQADLVLQARQLLETLKDRESLMQTVMNRTVSVPEKQELLAQSLNQTETFVDGKGVVVIDAKVIQGIFRGVALDAMNAPTVFDSRSNNEQRRALYRLIEKRHVFLAANPSPTLGAAKSALDAAQSGGSAIDFAAAAINSQLEAVVAALMSEKASKSYDDAVGFVIAHEIGHRALNHYLRLASGEPQRGLEEEADKFGAILLVLTRNKSVRANNGFPAYIPGTAMESSMGGPWCFSNINYSPIGHEVFFKYGYVLAGFDSLGAVDPAKYPSRAERSESTEIYTKAAYHGVADAQDATGSCLYDSRERQAIASNDDEHLRALLELRAKRLRKTEDRLKQIPRSEDDLEIRNILRPLVSAADVHDAVYKAAIARLR